jgi:hypothetical protein
MSLFLLSEFSRFGKVSESRYIDWVIDLSDAPVSALLELHGDLLAELRRRNVIRSSNNPTGDYGELLFSRAFGWTLNGNSSADADAVSDQMPQA